MSKTKKISPLDIWLRPSSFHATLSRVLIHYNRVVRSVAFFSFFLNLLMLAVPIYLLQIYDRVIPNRSIDTLMVLMAIILVAVIAYGVIDRLRNRITTKLGAWLQNTLSTELLSGSLRRSIDKETEVSAGVFSDLDSAKSLLTGSLLTSALDLLWTPIFILALFWLHPLLGWIVLAGVALMLMMSFLKERQAQSLISESSHHKQDSSRTARGFLKNAEVIHAMGMQNQLLPHWKQQYDKTTDRSLEADHMAGGLQSSVKTLRMALQIFVLTAAAWLILADSITAGATMASLLLMQRVVGPYERILSSWKYVIRGIQAVERINQRLDYVTTASPQHELPTPKPPITADKLRYRYEGQKTSLLSDASLTLRGAEIAVITGPSAAGKSTLLRLLANVIKPSSGSISISGMPYTQWPAEVLGRHIGYLPQTSELFDATVRQNIGRMEDADIHSVIHAAKTAGVHDFIEQLPQGYDTQVGHNGLHLSPGESRRICLARTVYRSPALVLLDEPDACLDLGGRIALSVTINKLRARGCAVLLVTQQAELMQFADAIYVLDDRKLSLIKGLEASPPKLEKKRRSGKRSGRRS